MSAERDTASSTHRESIRLALYVAPANGVPWVVRATLDQHAFGAELGEVLTSFRTMSSEQGMCMTDREIRHNCWAPMLAKLVDAPFSEIGETFKNRTLCFLSWVAFGDHVVATDAIEVFVGDDREVQLFRRPARIFRRNRCRLGRLPDRATS